MTILGNESCNAILGSALSNEFLFSLPRDLTEADIYAIDLL